MRGGGGAGAPPPLFDRAQVRRNRRRAAAGLAEHSFLFDWTMGNLVERLALRPDALTLIVARGDSMEPTIADGDDILVDAADRRVGKRRAIFVLRLDGTLVVKRLHLTGGMIAIESDNPDAAPIAPVPAGEAEVIGRVAWLGRKLG